jgi:hypothetical protein
MSECMSNSAKIEEKCLINVCTYSALDDPTKKAREKERREKKAGIKPNQYFSSAFPAWLLS